MTPGYDEFVYFHARNRWHVARQKHRSPGPACCPDKPSFDATHRPIAQPDVRQNFQMSLSVWLRIVANQHDLSHAGSEQFPRLVKHNRLPRQPGQQPLGQATQPSRQPPCQNYAHKFHRQIL